jgi:hypothetical protein
MMNARESKLNVMKGRKRSGITEEESDNDNE